MLSGVDAKKNVAPLRQSSAFVIDPMPVEARTRIGLSSRRDIAVPRHRFDRVAAPKLGHQSIEDHGAYPVQPGHQIYAGIDGYATCGESSAMRGSGNERVWKIPPRSRATITDSGVRNTGPLGSAQLVDRAWLADKQAGFFGCRRDNDWDALFRAAGSY